MNTIGFILFLLFYVLGAIEWCRGSFQNGLSLLLISSIFFLGLSVRYLLDGLIKFIGKLSDSVSKKAEKIKKAADDIKKETENLDFLK